MRCVAMDVRQSFRQGKCQVFLQLVKKVRPLGFARTRMDTVQNGGEIGSCSGMGLGGWPTPHKPQPRPSVSIRVHPCPSLLIRVHPCLGPQPGARGSRSPGRLSIKGEKSTRRSRVRKASRQQQARSIHRDATSRTARSLLAATQSNEAISRSGTGTARASPANPTDRIRAPYLAASSPLRLIGASKRKQTRAGR
jgi:hypothetical protein